MDGFGWLRAIASLGATLALVGLAAWGAHRMGLLAQFGATAPKLRPDRRLRVVESLMLSPRHRVVLLRADDREHLVLLGNEELVLESRDALQLKSEALP
jgi:flagellar protein FliO/FliZ